jgi:type IX secretion system PorP/SprF family membrane protein
MKNLKMKLSALFTVSLAMLVIHQAAGQTDPHFTQNYTYPMYINPALTGSSDGVYRVSAIYRTEWGTVGNPYRTTGISFDMPAKNNMAVGVNLLNEKAADGAFNYLTTYASAAYSGVKFGANDHHRLVFAMQAGIINRHLDQSNFKWGEQWNPVTGYNAANPTTESFAATKATSLDMGAGVLYYDAQEGKKYNAFGGVSFFHINRPKDPIISSGSVEQNIIPMRATIHGGVNIDLPEGIRLVPHMLYMQQGKAKELMLGVYGEKTINDETDILFGGYYRYKDAVAPFAGVDWKNFIIGLSYDVNASKLGAMAKHVNSFELTLTYIQREGTKSIFEFIRCPRL